MSKHFCPIEKRECGRVNTTEIREPCSCGVSATFEFYFSRTSKFERCPFPSKIKPIVDPGEGYELVPEGETITDCTEFYSPSQKAWRNAERIGCNAESSYTYRRPIAKVCPVTKERCKRAKSSDDRTVCTASNAGSFDVDGWKFMGFKRCPFWEGGA